MGPGNTCQYGLMPACAIQIHNLYIPVEGTQLQGPAQLTKDPGKQPHWEVLLHAHCLASGCLKGIGFWDLRVRAQHVGGALTAWELTHIWWRLSSSFRCFEMAVGPFRLTLQGRGGTVVLRTASSKPYTLQTMALSLNHKSQLGVKA